jgi:hypothetical protein
MVCRLHDGPGMMPLRSFPPLLLLLFLAWPAAARAQSTQTVDITCDTQATLSITFENRANDADTNRDMTYVNQADCTGDEIWEFNYSIPTPNDTRLVLYRSTPDNSECLTETTFPECTVVKDIVTQPDTGIHPFTFSVSDVLTGDCEGTNDVTLWFMLFSGDSSTLESITASCSLTLHYDMDPPDPPSITTASGSDQGARLEWETPTDDEDDHDKFVVYSASGAGATPDGDADADSDGDGGSDVDGSCEAASQLAGNPSYEDVQDHVRETIEEAATRSTRVSSLENGTTYAFAISAVDTAGNIGPASDPACATPQPVDDFFSQYHDAGGQSGFCYVATVAYGGDADHPDVRQLRWFRDNVLSRLPGGTWLIGQYYTHGPGLAAALAPHPVVKRIVRGALAAAVLGIRAGRSAGAWIPVALALTVLGACLLRSRRRRGGESGGNGDA